MRITFVGTGYVGLVSGVMLSFLGHHVTCLDIDNEKIAKLNNNILPIYEPELEHYLKTLLAQNKITFTSDYNQAVENADVIFITVGTPGLDSGDADLRFIFESVYKITECANNYPLIVIKSTVPPGTCLKLQENLKKNLKFKIASNPEFLREGYAVTDFLNPDRIVIGTSDQESEVLLKKVYQPLTDKGVPIVSTNLITAELIKYASNSFLATKIAFINEIADLSEKVGANIEQLTYGMGLDTRIGAKFLSPGPGFGGSCFPKDIHALAKFAKDQNNDFFVLNAVIDSNAQRPHNISAKIINLLGGNIIGKKLGVLGLAFKAGTDDIRSSPAMKLIEILQQAGAIITAFDPKAQSNAIRLLPGINYAPSMNDAFTGKDALIIATEWPEFKNIDLDKVYEQLTTKIIIDLRNILPVHKLVEKGFKYYSIGMKIIHKN